MPALCIFTLPSTHHRRFYAPLYRMKDRLGASITHYAQGLLMGSADIIPGVSGGTMALIVGIYRRLISALSSAFSAIVALLKLNLPGMRARLAEVEWSLIVPLMAGIVTALLIGARVIPALLDAYPYQSLGLFFGLVAASIAIPWKRIDRKTALVLLVAAVAALVAYILTGIPPREGSTPTALRIFASAAVAICAMILPGVSGAFLLKVMGMYEVTLRAVNGGDIGYVALFILGAVVGLGIFSNLLNYLLRRWANVTMAALVGLMAGALRALWPWQSVDRTLHLPDTGEPVASVVLLAVTGFLFVAALALWGDRLEERVEDAV